MGQEMSCSVAGRQRDELITAAWSGDLSTLKSAAEEDASLLNRTITSVYDRQSLLHIAASSGQIDILSWLLDQSMNPDVVNRRKQTPLMLAAKHGKISCVQKLIDAGANILMFDSIRGRTCLHYAAYYGNTDCLESILSAARSSHVAIHWGYARFVNIRDDKGATPLHLAARKRRPGCVHILLDNGALVSAYTSTYVFPASTPLHLAARGGSLDCIRELLAWGADRLQIDSSGRIPYSVAVRQGHGTCAALLNPSSAEPLVWPSPLKFISELNPEAKLLLEQALMDANREREKTILKGTTSYVTVLPSPSHSDDTLSDDNISETSETEDELCCICFDQVCTMEVQDCGHRMCAHCTLALCCHNKPNPTTSIVSPPVCPFCRSGIMRLVVANNDLKLRRSSRRLSWNASGEIAASSSFKGISSSFSNMLSGGGGRGGGSGRAAAAAAAAIVDDDVVFDKSDC